MKPYVLEFTILGLPKTPNQLLGAHWTVRSNHAKKWKAHVLNAILLNKYAPPAPLRKSLITCTRISAGRMDADGLSGSFKSLLDGLKAARVIEDDSPDHVTVRYFQEKGKRGHGHVRIKVESTQSDLRNQGAES